MTLTFTRRASRSCAIGFTVALAACGGSGTSQPVGIAAIQTSGPNAGVTATIVGDRVQIRNDLQLPVGYALYEQRYLQETLAIWCFGSGGCGATIQRGQTVSPLVSSAMGMSPSATKLVVVWWAIPEEPPPMGQPSTPYQIVLDLR